MDCCLITRTNSTGPAKMTLIACTSITLITPSPLIACRQSPNPDLAHEKLMRSSACFIYKKPGHIAIKCPEKTKMIHKLNTEQGKDLPSP